jgi:transcriptional regulator with XRE-family HTH domain
MNEKERIELLMKCYNLTASQLADKTGIQRASVSHILSGRNKPSLEVLQKIYEAFPELDIKWLMTGAGEEPVTPPQDSTDVQHTLFAQAAEPTLPQQPQPAKPATAVYEQEAPRMARVQNSAAQQQTERPKRIPAQRMPQAVKGEKRIKEIRIFYTDGTYETMFPEK